MPPCTTSLLRLVVPAPSSDARSTRTVVRPAAATLAAVAHPTIPPPMTVTSTSAMSALAVGEVLERARLVGPGGHPAQQRREGLGRDEARHVGDAVARGGQEPDGGQALDAVARLELRMGVGIHHG